MLAKSKVPGALIAIGLFTLVAFQNCGPSGGGGVTPVTSNGNLLYVEMSASEAQQMVSGFETQCSSLMSQSTSFPIQTANSSLTVSSYTTVRASTIISVSGIGNGYLFGTTSSAKVNSVSAFQGNLFLCNMSLGTVSGNGANVFVQGGSVDGISDFKGNVIILGSSNFPATVSNFSGNLILKTPSGQYLGRSYAQYKP